MKIDFAKMVVEGAQERLTITATTYDALLGRNNFKSRERAMAERIAAACYLRLPFEETPAMKRGRELEPVALAHFAAIVQEKAPLFTVDLWEISARKKWAFLEAELEGVRLRALPDALMAPRAGAAGDRWLVEIKVPSDENRPPVEDIPPWHTGQLIATATVGLLAGKHKGIYYYSYHPSRNPAYAVITAPRAYGMVRADLGGLRAVWEEMRAILGRGGGSITDFIISNLENFV